MEKSKEKKGKKEKEPLPSLTHEPNSQEPAVLADQGGAIEPGPGL